MKATFVCPDCLKDVDAECPPDQNFTPLELQVLADPNKVREMVLGIHKLFSCVAAAKN